MKKRLQRYFLFLVILTSVNTYAQLETYLINQEAWLKGDFVEIGVNNKGVFGNQTHNKPTSFHDNRERENFLFGFIANPKKDNWIDYDGDFFTPGNPEEGFAIEIDGVNYNNNNNSLTQIPGEIINVGTVVSDCFEDIAKANWKGTVDNLEVFRSYSITKSGLFIQMITSITNLGSDVKKNIYFMHNLDPDNNVTLTGIYDTDLTIISQPSTTNNVALVKATQNPFPVSSIDTDGSAISFYANDERARVTYGGFANRSASNIWNASGASHLVNTVGASRFGDEAISIAFNIGDIQPNETKSFVYYYILEEVDESFTPLIVNSTIINPTTCNGNDGSILFSGLDENEDYIISYTKNGILIPANTYTTDANGIIEFANLNSATYSNFIFEHDACTTNLTIELELRDPPFPVLNFTKTDPNNCDGNNGEILLSNLLSNEEVELSYDVNAVNIPTTTVTTNDSGEIIISNLSNGTFSNFNLKYVNSDCSASFTDEIILDGTVPLGVGSSVDEQFFCDSDFDYVTQINLEYIDSIILDRLNSSEYIITYHTSQENADNNVAISKTDYTTTGQDSYELFYRMERISTGCYQTNSFTITINLPVKFNMNGGFICLLANGTLDPDYNLPLDTGLDETVYTFEWFLNNQPLNLFTSSIIAEDEGRYKVTVTTRNTGCSISNEVDVYPSGKPTNVEFTVESGLFTNNYSMNVYATGIGNYEYRINNLPYQDNSQFFNITLGTNYFYINDINGCGEIIIEKLAVDYPPFFTPNNDFKNDLWKINGVESIREPKIHIFNRFGKLLKVLEKGSHGWDGIYNGKRLPSDDYWFVLYYHNENGERKEFRGHFALRR